MESMIADSFESFDPLREPTRYIASSAPVQRPQWLTPVIVGLVLIVIAIPATAIQRLTQTHLPVTVLVGLGLITYATVTMLRARALSRRLGAESSNVEAIGNLIVLRRWPEAVGLVCEVLSQPMLSRTLRLSALSQLASVLMRYHRFDDAVSLHDAILGDPAYAGDPATTQSLLAARAMALLREDRLVDADRALVQARRAAGTSENALNALVDIYRDVKTGHHAEAIALFEKHRAAMAEQLSFRVGDAWVLVATAQDALQRSDEAQQSYLNATLLVPAAELHRRYPETKVLSGRYSYAALSKPLLIGGEA
jgi:tetratricopeptide (TPR) repeat protein